MFGGGKKVRTKKFKASQIATVIGHGTTITGDVSFTGGLHLDGAVKGCLSASEDSTATLTISEQGSIEGNVKVANVILNGAVVGDVYASGRVELASKARVTGTVYYNLLEMTMGAEVNGQLKHVDEDEPRMLNYFAGDDLSDEDDTAVVAKRRAKAGAK